MEVPILFYGRGIFSDIKFATGNEVENGTQ